MTTAWPGYRAFQSSSDSAVIESASEQPAERFGRSTRLPGREDLGRLGHEVDAAEDDGGLRDLLPDDGEAERVADVVRDLLDLRELVVVGEDDRVLLLREGADLLLERGDLAGRQVAAGLRVRDGIVDGEGGQGHADPEV